jgi:hypothetical protein
MSLAFRFTRSPVLVAPIVPVPAPLDGIDTPIPLGATFSAKFQPNTFRFFR